MFYELTDNIGEAHEQSNSRMGRTDQLTSSFYLQKDVGCHGMMGATEREEHYHRRAINAEKKLEKVLSDSGLEKYKAECDATVAKVTARLEHSQQREGILKEKVCTLTTENKSLQKSCQEKDKMISKLEKENEELREELKQEKSKCAEKSDECENLKQELMKVSNELAHKKIVQRHDHTNSGKPSSTNPNHEKIINNSREKTDRKAGAQPGHDPHGRKRVETNQPDIVIPPPPEVLNDPERYVLHGEIRKQMVDLQVGYLAVDYVTNQYYDKVLKKYIQAEFPPLIKDDVNYGPVLRSTTLLLYHRCKASLGKVSETISSLTGGIIKPSTGWINGLVNEFNVLTDELRANWYDFLENDVKTLHTDATTVRVNGKLQNVYVCASGPFVLYFFREHKGHDGIKGTPVENSTAVLIHDHAPEFMCYGSDHQECLAHVIRYLKDSIMNEPGMEWNTKMLAFVQAMIHEAKLNDGEFSEERIAEIHKEWEAILNAGKAEYAAAGGPKSYYKDGYNLMIRMDEYQHEHLLFLRDKSISYTNNLSEALLREVKRRVHSVTSFRSVDNIISYCEFNSYIMTTLRLGQNPFVEMNKLYGNAFATSIDGMTNAEYAAWMQAKKRERRRLSENDSRRRAQEEALKVFEAHKKVVNKAMRQTPKDVKAAKDACTAVMTDLVHVQNICNEVKQCIYESRRKMSLLKELQNTVSNAEKKLETIKNCVASIDEQLKLSRSAKQSLEINVKESEDDITKKKAEAQAVQEKRDKQAEWKKKHFSDSVKHSDEGKKSVKDMTDLEFELSLAREAVEYAIARKADAQAKVDSVTHDIMTMEKRRSCACEALHGATEALNNATKLASELIPQNSDGTAA